VGTRKSTALGLGGGSSITSGGSTGFVRCITSASSATVAKIGRVLEPSSSRSLAPPAITADAGGATEYGVSPGAKVLDLKGRLLCRGCGRQRRAAVG